MLSVPGLPVRATAYIKYYFVELQLHGEPPNQRELRIYRAEHFNCYGKKFRGHAVYLWDGATIETEGNHDMRSLKLLIAGCCPPELESDMLEGFG